MAVAEHTRYPSPLRYPGGKGKIANFVKLLMLKNGLVGTEYAEPYAGGAAVALDLLFEDYASHIHINDLNPSVSAFWRVVLDQSDELCARVLSTPVTVAEWRRQRAVQDRVDVTDLELAFSTFFLNRTSRSGIIGGGIIGGIDQRGNWKIDARFARSDLVRRIQRIARHRSRITVTCLDATAFLEDRLPEIDDAFVYLDPPYFVKGGELYQDSYSPEDHELIAAMVRRLSVPWMVSYDAAPPILALYRGLSTVRYDLSYSAQVRYQGEEAMFFSEDLSLPDVETPANVSWRIVNEAQKVGT